MASHIFRGNLVSISELSIKQFLSDLGSSAPTPGGGSAASLSAAMGISLTQMVGELTTGKIKYQEFEAFTKDLIEQSEKLQAIFLSGIQEDIEAFKGVSAVYALPNQTEEEKKIRQSVMQEALKKATLPPFSMMENTLIALELTQQALGKSNSNAISDIGVAALNLKAAMQGSWLNVKINLHSIKDEAFVKEYQKAGEELLEKGLPLADDIYKKVLNNFK